MKQLFTIITILFIFTTYGCKKDEITPDERKEMIIGSWTVEENIKYYSSDSIVNENNYNFELQFNKDGSGVYTSQFIVHGFIWNYQFSPEKISYIDEDLIFGSHKTFSLKLNSQEKQHWEYIEIFQNTERFYTWKMNRK